LLAKYYFGTTDHRANKKRYVDFLTRYFPSTYDPVGFYAFVRCGLVHGFNLESKYIVLCKDGDWAKNAHMKLDSRSGKLVINPFALFTDTDKAFKAFLDDIRRDMTTQKRFFQVHKVSPLAQQQARWRKMKHLGNG
jgi:hypothetical protein